VLARFAGCALPMPPGPPRRGSAKPRRGFLVIARSVLARFFSGLRVRARRFARCALPMPPGPPRRGFLVIARSVLAPFFLLARQGSPLRGLRPSDAPRTPRRGSAKPRRGFLV